MVGKNEGESLCLKQDGNDVLSKTLSNKRGALLEVIESLLMKHKLSFIIHSLLLSLCLIFRQELVAISCRSETTKPDLFIYAEP